MTELIRSERRGAVALVTLASPDTLNSLSTAMLQALAAALGEVAGDESLRALVLTGEGRAFAAGADIEEMSAMTAIEGEAFSRLGHETFGALEALAIPTLAAVNGFALGGGCELALACDWIYASTKARFGQPEVKLGLIPGFGGTSRLVRRVGIGWAKELILAAENLKADEAMRIGLVNRVFEPDELLDSAMMAGQAIAERGPLAVRIAKRVLQEGQDADLRLANTLEQNAFGLVFASEDSKEGTKAFLEKRDPEFNGR
ncbi:MAG: enoyl-CoA hydratase/isomerase family protein [Deltaproteobacteria bacterium]|nr:enoyl-CoA hydratase/isomerase family protein [Deltaproteobacteria bacterium]